MKAEYSDQVVFITGGASGMALLAGKNYLELGAKVVLADINETGLSVAADSLSDYTDRLFTVICDVTDYSSVTQARDAAIDHFGRIDILLCFAGGAENRIKKVSGPFWEIPADVMHFGIDLNLKGTMNCCHAFFSPMVQQKHGIIITIGSISGIEPAPRSLAYNVAKSAIINGLTPSIAQAGAPHGIRCCCVSPGPVLTRKEMNVASTLMKRAARPQEIIDLILYLTSEKASFMTGQNYIIDGGRLLMEDKADGQNLPLND